LTRLLTTIESTAVSVGGTLDARAISLTVREIEERRRGGTSSIESTAVGVGCALLARTGGNVADRGVGEGTSALSVNSARNA